MHDEQSCATIKLDVISRGDGKEHVHMRDPNACTHLDGAEKCALRHFLRDDVTLDTFILTRLHARSGEGSSAWVSKCATRLSASPIIFAPSTK